MNKNTRQKFAATVRAARSEKTNQRAQRNAREGLNRHGKRNGRLA